ncbi:MAG: DoxX family protein [Gemmatimonadaceae bacterium]
MDPHVNLETISIGLLIMRVVIGILMAAHGAQKLLGWFGGYGLRNTGEFMVQLGFPSGPAFAAAAALAEITSGLLVTFGFLGPIGPALMISVMIVAMITVHWDNGLFAMKNGIELPLVFASAALGIALIGFGRYSLDAALGIDTRFRPAITAIVLAVGILGGFVNAAIRRKPAGKAGA